MMIIPLPHVLHKHANIKHQWRLLYTIHFPYLPDLDSLEDIFSLKMH